MARGAHDLASSSAAGASSIPPISGAAKSADLYIRDGRIGAAPGADVRDRSELRPRRQGRHARRHRHPQPCRRRQGQSRPRFDDRGPSRPSNAPMTASGAAAAAMPRPRTFLTGYRYAELGYTAAFEPAMVPSNARHTHAELADTPMIDKGCYVMLGNDDFLLRLLAERRRAAGDQRLCRLDDAAPPSRWRSRWSTPAASAPSSSTAASSASTFRPPTTA